MFVTGSVSLRDIYSHLDAPMLIMLAALIPISDALKTTGTTDVIAQLAFSNRGDAASLWGSCTYLSCRLAVAPFLNNAATVLVMLPIAAPSCGEPRLSTGCVLDGCRHRSRLRLPDPGRSPVQHCGYGTKRLSLRGLPPWGLPLSIIVLLVSVPMLLLCLADIAG
ncbi:SLC13 family permease [Pararhizobium sp. DWP3-4]|uniref:SLC13 family permease n=1 Tax=Pararhizobium sp. DWP3-4 TaxID=2804565 RepID=UPI003CF2D586